MNNTLYIIDGHAQIYRSYFAVMGLKSPSGEPTNATFGFVGMLLKLYQNRKPTHVVLAMDAGSSGRESIDPAYKVQRKPMPEDMPPQIDRILQIADILQIPIYRAEGFEADDAIATLVRQVRTDPACSQCKIYMATKDKDLDQLIDDQTVMYDIQTNEEINAAALMAKKGYLPTQARDVLALTGDSVDNIPGIPGVGPKTAAKWIQQYGDIDNLIAHQSELTGKIGETFRNNVHLLTNSRQLVELQFDVPVPKLDWHSSAVRLDLLPKLAPIFHDLGFSKLLTTLQQVANQSPQSPAATAAVVPSPRPAPPQSKIENQKSKIPTDSTSGGLFDQTPSDAPLTLATAAPEHAMQTDSDLDTPPSPNSHLQPVLGTYTLINTPDLLDEMLTTLRAQLAEPQPNGRPAWLSVDTETDALGSMSSNLCGISLSAKEATGFYIPVKGAGDVLDIPLVTDRLGPLLSDPAIPKVGQNLKYDINSLRNVGIQLNNIHFDTMVASYVIDSSRMSHGMDALAADLLGLQPIPISDLIGKGAKQISFADVPLSRAAHYASEDADVTLRLANILYPKLIAEPEMQKLFHDVEMPLVQVLADMEYQGVMIDTKLLKDLSSQIESKLVDLQSRIQIAAGKPFNQDSPKQLAEILFKHLGLPVIKKTKTGPSTDITVLEKLSDSHPVPALVVEYRSLNKLKNTYLDTLSDLPSKKTGRVHAHFNQTVAETGRLSSSDPNLQNIPIKTDLGKEIRRAFVAAPEHVLLSADYSQIELRVLAHYCGEKALVDAFANNIDVHRLVAAELNNIPADQVTPEMRAIAKTVNFGIIYGQTGFGLSQVLKIPQDQANQYVAAYRRRFPAIETFTHECIMQATTQGYVTTILGRRRLIPQINSSIQSSRQFGQRAALNSVIQGSAADLIKLAMVNIHRKIEPRSQDIHMLMQIHDELVFECKKEFAPEFSALIRTEMETAMKLKVPLKVDLGLGPNWLENE